MNITSKVFLVLLLFSFHSVNVAAEKIIIKYKKNHSYSKKQNAYLKNLANEVHEFPNINNLETATYKNKADANKALDAYRRDSNIEYAEMDKPLKLYSIPNDTSFSLQWGLSNSGQTGGLSDVDINAPEAWELSNGSQNIIIGLIDSGVNYNHIDIIDNLWVNPGEIPDNDIDDDENGYVDDIYGINTNNPSGNPLDDNGHGTHVAGIIAASGNNSQGVTGVMQKAKIITCKFTDEFGSGTTSSAIACIDYFSNLNNGMIATNNSWGGGSYSQALYDAIKSHMDLGILFVAAAGNDAVNNDLTNSYPANYSLPNIISVAAIQDNGELASFSNYGPYSVHVAAPGAAIYSTYNSSYSNLSGTSMATPFVTGLVGLTKSNDNDLSWINIKNRILSSGKNLNSLSGTVLTGKLIKAYDVSNSGALNCLNQTLTKHISPKSTASSIEIGSSITLSLLNINCGESLGTINAAINNEDILTIPDDGEGIDLVANDGVCTKSWTPTIAKEYQVTFSEQDTININVYDSAGWAAYGDVTAPSFNYRDITSTGIALNTGDESITLLQSPINIAFAGGAANKYHLYIGSNGTISLTDFRLAEYLNLNIPQTSFVTLISPYWDDLIPIENNENSGIFYGVIGESPNQELVIEWRNMRHYSLLNSDITFEVVFFESNSSILFNYLDTDSGSDQYNNGKSATIGIQTKTNIYKLHSFNNNSVTSEYSLLFQPGTSSSELANPNNLSEAPVTNNNSGDSGGGGGGGGGTDKTKPDIEENKPERTQKSYKSTTDASAEVTSSDSIGINCSTNSQGSSADILIFFSLIGAIFLRKKFILKRP